MTPWVRKLVGLLSHVPIIYMAIFMGFIFWLFTHAMGKGPGGSPQAFLVLMIAHLFVMLLLFGLMTFYVIWLLKGTDLPMEAKIIWTIAVLFLGPIIMPLLYWLYLRKTPAGDHFFGGPLT